jgi:hypothetical protein
MNIHNNNVVEYNLITRDSRPQQVVDLVKEVLMDQWQGHQMEMDLTIC